MKYFQIRISQHLSLEQFLRQLSNDVCLKLAPFLPVEKNSANNLLLLQGCIQSTIKQEMQKCPNCGLAAECHEDVEGGPWLDYTDKIFMMCVDDTFEKLIDRSSKNIVDKIFCDISVQAKLKLSAQMAVILKHELSKHLYYNPSCKAVQFCELRL